MPVLRRFASVRHLLAGIYVKVRVRLYSHEQRLNSTSIGESGIVPVRTTNFGAATNLPTNAF